MKRGDHRMNLFDRLFQKPQDRPAPPPRPSVHEKLAEFAKNIARDKVKYPKYADEIDAFGRILKPKYKAWLTGGDHASYYSGSSYFFLAEDRLSAFAYLLPPPEGCPPADSPSSAPGGSDSPAITLETFLSELRYEGIVHGILQDQIEQFIASRYYFHIFPVAFGTLPKDGQDGVITELFQRRGVARLELPDEGRIDFGARDFVQSVRTGEVICRIQPPMPGEDGMDVTGRVLPCHPSAPFAVPGGPNTHVGDGGLTLEAAVDGLLYTSPEGEFYVRKQQVIDGDFDAFTAPLIVNGDLYITGSVSNGVTVEATGDIIINGEVRDATVISTCGSIRIQQGIHGVDDQTVIRAEHQLQTPTIELASVETGGSVITEIIADSSIRCGETVNALGGHGMIVGGKIQANRRVLCRRIGNLSGKRTVFMVGCPSYLFGAWEVNRKQTDETKEMLDKLWNSISTLRKNLHPTEEQKEVIKTLLEQRELYEKKREELKTEKDSLRTQMRAAKSGQIRCQELHPVVELQLGEQKRTIDFSTVNCNIHLLDSGIVLQ